MKIFGRILLVLIFFSSTCFVSTSVQAAPKSFTLDSSKIYHYATYGKKKTSKTTYRYHTLYRYWKGTKQQELWDLQTTEKYYWGSDLGVLYVIQRDAKKALLSPPIIRKWLVKSSKLPLPSKHLLGHSKIVRLQKYEAKLSPSHLIMASFKFVMHNKESRMH